jgi:citrate lyase subunit beta/citryl-CoA lyase
MTATPQLRPARRRRACLTVPASSERMLAKAATLFVDEVVIDLEDSVVASEKTDETRRRAARAIASLPWSAPTIAVRVNAVGSQWFARDLEVVAGEAGARLDCIVLPKVERCDDVRETAALLSTLERGERSVPLGIEAQIESARGLIEVEAIAACSPRLEALVFGPADFSASLGLPRLAIGADDPSYPGDPWHYPRSRIAIAAHAYGLDPIDGPYGEFDDLAGLQASARQAAALGYVGKWVIHPRQIATCSEVFSPSAELVEAAHAVLAALADAQAQGRGATVVDGGMVDEASIRVARAIVARAEGPTG